MKRVLEFTATILCIAIVFTSLPIFVKALEVPGYSAEDPKGGEPEFAAEISEKRTANTKTFLMSDRSETVAVYETPVHYKENGKWEDVDNSFYSVDDESIENSKNIFKTKFAKESGENRLAEITKDSFSLKWNLIDCNRTTADYTEKSEEETENISILKNVVGSVLYKDILHDTDIYYDVSSGGLKESIVLKSEDSPNEFRFTYESDDLDAVEEDGSIIFKNPEGEKVFEFEKFYMFDSDLAESDNIEVEINEIENGVLLTIKPDEEWINSDERKWPIVIDPGIIGTQNATDVWDIDLKLNQTSAFNYKAADFLVGSNGSSTVYRSLVRFVNLPDLGSNSRIVSAKMNITAYQGPIKSGDPSLRTRPTDSINVCVHKMTANWPEQGAMWSTYGNSYSSEVEDYFTYNNTSDGFVADITQAVTEWYQNPASNYGVILKAETENASNHIMQFTSSDYGTNGSNAATWRPVLGVNYRNTTGIEDYWSYSTYSADEFGISYVNNANGNMIYEYTDYEYNAEINSFSLKHIYNSSESDGAMGRYGKGWRLNLVQRFEPVSGTTANYVYTDGDGTKHYFSQAEGSSKIIDEDGLGYEYTSISEGEWIYKLTAKDGSVMKFDQWGFLRRIIDPNNNEICLNYSPAPSIGTNYLTSVSTKSANESSSSTVIVLHYTNFVLTDICANGSEIVSYNYENSSLRHPQKADGTGPYFWFTGKVSAVRYGNEQRIGYTYDSQNRISNVTMQDNASNTKESIGYAYKYNVTTLTDNVVTLPDNTHRQMTYEFDAFGRPVCVFDNQGNTAYCDYSTVSTNISQIYKNNKAMLTGSSSNYINNLFANGYLFFGTNGYNTYDYSGGAGSITAVTGEGLVTSSSLKIAITPSQTTGRTLVVAQAPSTTSGKTYTYSAYIKTNNLTPDDPSNSHHGALLKVTTNQNNQYFSEAITGTTDPEVDNGYEKISVTFTIGANEYITTASAGIFNSNGDMYIDCLQFEENETANHINIINNSGFERLSGSVPTSFGYTGNAGITSSTTAQSGSRSVAIPGNTTTNKTVYQILSQSGSKGDVYTFGAWAKANSVPNTNGHASFRAYLNFTYTDNTTEDMIVDFNPNVNDWQFVTKTVKAAKNYSQIVLYLNYHKNCGQALFDSVFLYRDTAQAYSYDSNGNLVSTTDAAKQNSTFQYSGNNISKLLNPTGTSFEYSYDSRNNLIYAKSSSGIKNEIEYDENGNPVSTRSSSDSYSLTVQPDKTYYIRQKGSGKYLSASATSANTDIKQRAFGDATYKTWKFEKVDGNYYYIKLSADENKAVGINNGSNDDNAAVKLQTKSSSANHQKFKLVLKGDGSYKFTPKSSTDTKLISVSSSTAQDVILQHYIGSTNENQQWFIEEVPVSQPQISAGVYSFRNRNSGKYLDTTVSSGSLTQYHYGGLSKQRFVLHAIQWNNQTCYRIESGKEPGKYLTVTQTQNNGLYNIEFAQGDASNYNVFRFDYSNEKCRIINDGNDLQSTDDDKCLAVPFSSLAEGANVVAVGLGVNATRYWIPERLTEVINSSATYSNNGKRLTSSTDSRGKTTGYTYLFDGKISTVTDPKNVTTTYTYDQGSDRLSSVSTGNSTVGYTYVNDTNHPNNKLLSSITSPSGTVYNFAYDTAARVHSISVVGSTLSTNTYDSAGRLSSMTYGNGASVGYTYDGLDRVTQKLYNNVVKFEYTYDKLGNLVRHNNLVNNTTTKYAYDLIGRILNVKSSNGTSLFYKYDQYNRTNFIKYIVGGKSVSLKYVFGLGAAQNPDFLYGIQQNGTDIISYSYDKLARLNSRTLNTTTGFTSNYTYLAGANAGSTTTLIESINNGGNTLSYTYDDVGNITEIKKNDDVYESYEYDGLNQLTKVTRGTGEDADYYTYTYDNGGNILEVKLKNTTVKSYKYDYANDDAHESIGWKDLLTKYNDTDIEYDDIGNPIVYRDGFSFTWSNGRQLTGVTHGTDSISYQYDDNGLRTQKTVNGVTTEYYRLNGVLLGQKTGSEYIIYLYDENGAAYGLLLKNGTTEEYYYYIYNAQGDVIGIIDESGTQVVEYDYDAWGKVLSITGTGAQTIGEKNPIRYRGYYYDNETGFYYLQSRYYDPEIGRFINSDSVIDNRGIITLNLFQYCGNNPVNNADANGKLFGTIIGIGLLVVGMVATLSGCSSKSVSKSSKPSPSSNSTSSISTPVPPLTQEQKHFVSAIAGEAIGTNTKTQKAVAHTIMNRVNEPRDVWSKAKTVSDVLISAQYNAVGSNQYNLCMSYLNNRDGSNERYESLITAVIPIYNGEEADFTNGAHYIFNINGSAGLLKSLESQPDRYVKCGPFKDISDIEYRMYRCLW